MTNLLYDGRAAGGGTIFWKPWNNMEQSSKSLSRRDILAGTIKAGIVATIAPGLAVAAAAGGDEPETPTGKRRRDAISIRERAAALGAKDDSKFTPIQGSDEKLRIEQFSKILRRDSQEPVLAQLDGFKLLRKYLDAAYARTFTRDGFPDAPDSKNFEELEAHIGNEGEKAKFHFTNPLGGFSFDLEGTDPALSKMPDHAPFDSARNAAEMAELYWMAVLRDENLNGLDPNLPEDQVPQIIKDAIADLNKFSWWSSPEGSGAITRKNFLRAQLPKLGKGFSGVEVGPYISQFLLRGTIDPGIDPTVEPNGPDRGFVNFGSFRVRQTQRTVIPNRNFLVNPDPSAVDPDPKIDEWYQVQNGRRGNIGKDKFEKVLYFIRTLRDGANYVHFDEIYQEYLIAASILLAEIPRTGNTFLSAGIRPEASRAEVSAKSEASPFRAEHGITATDLLNIGNPYRTSKSQVGFATFGVTHILTLLAEVSTRAHKAGWYHKWRLRRIRPEEFGARVDANIQNGAKFPIPAELQAANNPPGSTGATVLNRIFALTGNKSYLLPQAFPEGCPTHPAYPSGHATVAGASVTVLKALFNEDFPLTSTEQPAYRVAASGTALENYSTEILTVGGELNKLASNITYFRGMAGVHWTSDNIEGMLLGERVAIELLVEQTVSSDRDKHAPFYRERLLDEALVKKVKSSSPFFRLTTFSGRTIDIFEGKICDVRKGGQKKTDWDRSEKEFSYDEFISSHYQVE